MTKVTAKTAVAAAQTDQPIDVEIVLSSGKKATIRAGKGKDNRMALRDADGDGEKYLHCFMARLILIDGKKIIPEDLDELPSRDYAALQAANVGIGNF